MSTIGPLRGRDRDLTGASGQNTLVTIMFFAAGIVFLDRFGITFLFPQIGAELHLTNSQLGSLVSVTAVTWAVSSLIFSVLSDRFGGRVKWLIVASLVLFSSAVALIGLAEDYRTMLLFRAIIGFCEGPALPLIQGAVARASSPERRGRNLGIVIAGTLVIGSALAPGIMVGLATAVGWRPAFALVAVPGIVVALLVAVFMRDERSAAGTHRVRARDFRLVLANRNVLLALVGTTVCIGSSIGFGTFAPVFLAARGHSPATSTLVLTVYGLVIALGNIVAPAVSDRFGRRPALCAAAVCGGLLPVFFVLFADSVPLLLVSLVVGLMAGGGLTLITYVVPGESVPPELMATAFALQIAVGETVGGTLGPQIGGAVADATHDLANALLLYGATPIVLVLVSLLIRETAPRRR
ncbi:putative MFS family arabinose efflux permease [Saccharothrix tamanrassetensis]|uniref:Putative MFS family arabinose efflux permease n=1 Tax=Saccharothrix tamanrassetensis TaxID=1051531 RepID=A0A841CMX1_9PSEU|nr:MFS transporter [Saccharothrix tamanrassetensis]MBB5957345.1 putative MFS family arabinose efflux permease [Saccharothrix tamanrassetensis]